MNWTEAYRPQKFDEVIGQDDVVKMLERLVRSPKELPNLLFSGLTGTGKTTVARILAKDVLGEQWERNYLVLNASDERKIETIRTKVKNYLKIEPYQAPFKIIFMDEFDQMTKDAQFAMRTIMEDFMHINRFILSCNHPNKIIEPIRGRCALLTFKPIAVEDTIGYFKHILEVEGYECEDIALEVLAKTVMGNMRVGINQLQLMANLSDDKKITGEDSLKVIKSLPRKVVYTLYGRLQDDNKLTDEKLKVIDDFVVDTFYDGVDYEQVLELIMGFVVESKKLTPEIKSAILRQIGLTDYRIIIGANPMLQLRSFLYNMECLMRGD